MDELCRRRIEQLDDLATFLGGIDVNAIRCLFIDGHGDVNGNIYVGESTAIPPEAIRVALLASIAAHGGFMLAPGAEPNPIPVIFGTCFNHATIARLEAGGVLVLIANCLISGTTSMFTFAKVQRFFLVSELGLSFPVV